MVRFQRPPFHGEYAANTPKWHILKGEITDPWGQYVALCEYSFTNVFGGLRVSIAKNGPKKSEMCYQCLKKAGQL